MAAALMGLAGPLVLAWVPLEIPVLAEWGSAVWVVGLPGAAGAAVLRYRLDDRDRILRRPLAVVDRRFNRRHDATRLIAGFGAACATRSTSTP